MDVPNAESGAVSEPVTSVSNPRPALWRRARFLAVLAVGIVGLSLLLLFGTLAFIAHPVKVEGAAMEPTLRNGDRLMIQKITGELNRGDIVTFYYPRDTSKSFVERVIALPGETISIAASGAVYINDREIHEPYVSADRNRSPRQQPKLTLAAQEYFIMGDNRDAANDSRSWGTVDRKLIYGKVIGRYWPITR